MHYALAWKHWNRYAPDAAKVALDQAIQGHLMDPENWYFWWARGALASDPAPPWLSVHAGSPPNWERILAARGANNQETWKTKRKHPTWWVPLLPRRTYSAPYYRLATPILLGGNDSRFLHTVCNRLSFSYGYYPPYHRSGTYIPGAQGFCPMPYHTPAIAIAEGFDLTSPPCWWPNEQLTKTGAAYHWFLFGPLTGDQGPVYHGLPAVSPVQINQKLFLPPTKESACPLPQKRGQRDPD